MEAEADSEEDTLLVVEDAEAEPDIGVDALSIGEPGLGNA
jgi:hypothetical protein